MTVSCYLCYDGFWVLAMDSILHGLKSVGVNVVAYEYGLVVLAQGLCKSTIYQEALVKV